MHARTGRHLLLLTAAVLASLAVFAALFLLDNKYAAALSGGPGYNLLQDDPERVAFLVEGWEYYPGQSLEPEDFLGGVSPQLYTYIGQYPNFSKALGTPYGQASYRLVLRVGEEPVDLALYLPELLCAGRVYIGGELVGEQGGLDPYEPLVMDGLYAFTAQGEVEIIVQCANYTHYYSGLYYPPAVGTLGAVSQMQTARLMVYGLLCFAALSLALSNLAQWLFSRDRFSRWMGLMSLFFALRVCYPFLRALGAPSVRLLYALEDVCGNLVLLSALLLAGELCGAAGQRFHSRAAVPIGASFCAATVLFPILILPYVPSLINIYGILLFLWQLAAGAYLLFLAGQELRQNEPLGRFLLCVAGLFGLSVILSALTVNRFEPIRGAWPEEYGGFALVAGFASLMALRGVQLTRENRRLTDHLQEEVAERTRWMETLLAERRELLANLLHDLKNPLAALRSYAELVRSGGVALDQETAGYLEALLDRANAVEQRFDLIQDFSRSERGVFGPTALCLNDFLRKFYATNRPDMELSGASFLLHLPAETLVVRGEADRLETALENLCYNALSFLPPNGRVTLSLGREERYAVVSVADTGSGIAPEDLPRIFDRGFTRRADNSGDGLGLYIVRAVALEHNGTVDVESQPGKGSVFTLRLPLWQEGEA